MAIWLTCPLSRILNGFPSDFGLLSAAGRVTITPTRSCRWADIIDDSIFLADRIRSGRHLVRLEALAHSPGYVVIGAGCIAAHSQTAHDAVVVVKRQAASDRPEKGPPGCAPA